MTDQQRYDWIGLEQPDQFDTPNLDGLAKRGIVFSQAYSAATTCAPARNSLLTGLHPVGLPIQGATNSLAEGYWTIAHALRGAGYQTALVGRMHFSPMHASHGFDVMRICENNSAGSGYGPEDVDDYGEWLAAHGRPDWRRIRPNARGRLAEFDPKYPRPFPDTAEFHSTSWIRDEALSLLARRRPETPLFLIVSFPHPHAPYDPPEPYASMYDDASTLVPDSPFSINSELPPMARKLLESTPWGAPVHRFGDEGPHYERRALTMIRGLVNQIDDAVGQIVGGLDPENTVVFFTSDHGDYGGHRGLMHKAPWLPFDDLARVPLIVTAPDGRPGTRSSDLVQSHDMALTFLDYAGVEPPSDAFVTRSLRSRPPGASQAHPHSRTGPTRQRMGASALRYGSRSAGDPQPRR